MPIDDAPLVHVETRAQWREWLIDHHDTTRAAWLVTWRSGTGRPAVAYDDAVREALTVGWIDSTRRRLDDERTQLYFCPRRPGSGWARPNKPRVAELVDQGLMLPAGQRVIDAAQADGSWTLLDDVEDLVVPADLDAAFTAEPGARARWDALPRSPRREMLVGLVQARRKDTRRRRIAEIVRGVAGSSASRRTTEI